jgi:hypothetical protein
MSSLLAVIAPVEFNTNAMMASFVYCDFVVTFPTQSLSEL